MTKMKLCGLTRPCDIEVVNELQPEYIGFVFWPKSKRYVTKDQARALKEALNPSIKAVGVFVDEDLEKVLDLLNENIIDMAQLHGKESQDYIVTLREKSKKEVIKAFTIKEKANLLEAKNSPADYVLLDSGKGSGMTFNWNLIKEMDRPYFLAGGIHLDNVADAHEELHPFAFDISSGIETDGLKDAQKMKEFVNKVRSFT